MFFVPFSNVHQESLTLETAPSKGGRNQFLSQGLGCHVLNMHEDMRLRRIYVSVFLESQVSSLAPAIGTAFRPLLKT